MLRRLAAFFAFLATFVIASSASAAVVRDADKFSVDTGAARICWVTPLTLRNAADCEGLTPDAVPQPQDGEARVIAMGLVRLEEPGEAADIALVMVMHVVVPFTLEPDQKAADDYADGAQKAVAKGIRKGATMRTESSRLVKLPRNQYPLIRMVLDADGIPDVGDDALLQHQIHIAGIADDGVYSVAYLTKRRNAKRVEAYADAIGPSFHMTKPATSNKDFEKKVEGVVKVVMLLGTLLVGGVISLIVVMSRRNKPAPYAYPYPYQGQPSSYPPPAWHPASVAQPPSQAQPQYQPRYYSMQSPAIPPPPAVPRREWWDELQ